MAADDTEETVRVYVGGLFPGAAVTDLQEKFASFGSITDVKITARKDDFGNVVKTFAHLNMFTTKKKLQKCFSIFNHAKWKGSQLLLHKAKESFLTKLNREREEANRISDEDIHNVASQAGILQCDGKGAVPGKNWVIGKFGRVLPVMHLKRPGKKKPVSVDPSRLCHNLKRLKSDDCGVPGDRFTWVIDDPDTEITRRRKGDFPRSAASVDSRAKTQRLTKFLQEQSMHQAKLAKEANNFEIVQGDGRVVQNDRTRRRCEETKVHHGGLKSSGLALSAHMDTHDGDSDADSADTDEIIAATKNLYNLSGNVADDDSCPSGDDPCPSGDDPCPSGDDPCPSGDEVVCVAPGRKEAELLETSDSNDLDSSFEDEVMGLSHGKKKAEVLESTDAFDDLQSSSEDEGQGQKDPVLNARSSRIPQFLGRAELDKSTAVHPLKGMHRGLNTNDSGDDMMKYCDSNPVSSANTIKSSVVMETRKVKNTEEKKPKVKVESGDQKRCSTKDNRFYDDHPKPGQYDEQPDDLLPSRHKQRDDNLRRLETLKERKQEVAGQKATLQRALADVDTGARLNKKIVFDSDSEDEEKRVDGTRHMQTLHTTETRCDHSTRHVVQESDAKKSLALFNSSGSESDSDEEAFRVRPQYEGQKGQKLMELQSRFGNDKRFQMDEKFIDSDDGDESAEGEMSVLNLEESERTRTLRILQDVVGSQPVARLLKQERQRKTFRDVRSIHFDPEREEHHQFEILSEPKDKVPRLNREKPRSKKEVGEETVSELPEVGKERFYEVSTDLQNVFLRPDSKDSSAGFSLLATFQQEESTSDPEDMEDTAMEKLTSPSAARSDTAIEKLTSPSEARSQWPGQSVMEKGNDDSSDDDSSDGYLEHSRGTQAPSDIMPVAVVPFKKPTFFFCDDDERLEEGVKYFSRPADFETSIRKWQNERPKLLESYKEKMRKAVKNRRRLELVRDRRYIPRQRPRQSVRLSKNI